MKGASLRTKLLLWNASFFIASLSIFGATLIYTGARSANSMLDNLLLDEANRIALHGPGPGRGFGGPDRPPFDVPRPRPRNESGNARVADADGHSMGPDGSAPFFSKELFDRSRHGETVWGNAESEGRVLRVVSLPINRRDGAQVIQVARDSDAIFVAQRAQALSFFITLPFLALASFGIAELLAKFVLGPISRLTKTAQDIADNPKKKEIIEVNGNDEIARLSSAFNVMTERLQDTNERLETSLDQQKRFTSDAAHELRTPLTSISLAAENALHPEATKEEIEKSLEVVARSAATMGRLTDVLLSLARLDRQTTLAVEPTDLRLPTSEALRELGLESSPRIAIAIADGAVPVPANRDAVKQIVRNLVENAVAHSPEGSLIEIRQEGATLAIADHGEGISEEQLPHIFDRFYRVDPSRTRTKGGHGLGLSIVQALALAQGATVDVESKLNLGTTFFINFHDSPQSS